ncbi:MAG: SgcJ/EcaC family oxidoreductase [Devosia sp.]
MTDERDQAAVREAIALMVRKRFDKDPSIADDFEADAVLIGSDSDEVAFGIERIRAYYRYVMKRPYAVQLTWDRLEISTEGDLAWFQAEGAADAMGRGQTKRTRYRLSGLLARRDGVWRWRLFHGSEPRL